jgi:type IV secretion system protein VirB9
MAPWSAVAQTMPSPSLDDPRLQTLVYDPARPARLVAFAGANLTLMLMPGDQIEKVTTSDRNAFDVRITESNDSLNIMPLRPDAAATLVVTNYKLSGDRSLLPAAMSDDGRRTYIQWGEYQSLPAVFGIGPTGQEEVVDGYVRDGKFTIDRVYGQIVFRIDKRQAIARRLGKKVG